MITKPQPDEYMAFAGAYVSQIADGEDVMEVLEVLQTTTYNLFSNMDEELAMHAYAQGKWTLKEVLGHMIDTERVFTFRAFCFSREQTTLTLPGFDQDTFVNNSNYNSRSIQSLAAEFRAIRESTLYLFGNFTQQQLIKTGIASGNPVTVRALVYMAAGHERHHLNIIKERYL